MLSPHKHTGRLLPHHRTSYFELGFVVLLAGLVLLSLVYISRANDQVAVGAVVPYPTPTSPPTITSPADGSKFNAAGITVRGSCHPQMMVAVYKNGAFAGSTPCQSGGFSVNLDLTVGSNKLVAREITGDNQVSPDSNMVVVSYALPAPVSGRTKVTGRTIAPAGAMVPNPPIFHILAPFIASDAEQNAAIELVIDSGVAPFGVEVNWGDGSKNSLYSRAATGAFRLSHHYDKTGIHKATLRMTDAAGGLATLEVAVSVLSPSSDAATADPSGRLLVAWPMYIVVLLVLLSFWLGERHEISALSHKQP